jgi:hypothetical protein
VNLINIVIIVACLLELTIHIAGDNKMGLHLGSKFFEDLESLMRDCFPVGVKAMAVETPKESS